MQADDVEREATILGQEAVRQRMQCKPVVAQKVVEAFVTVEQLLDAAESEVPLTDVHGIGPKTAEAIEDWYENREEREQNARRSTFKRTSNTSASIKFHLSWADALGIKEGGEA